MKAKDVKVRAFSRLHCLLHCLFTGSIDAVVSLLWNVLIRLSPKMGFCRLPRRR